MLLDERIAELIAPSVTDLGYDLVRVQYRGQTRKTLQIMAERRDECPMTVDDCEILSNTISALLDVADPIRDRYALEVSSPGIDRPLVKPADFERFKGFQAKADLNDLYNGRRHLEGVVGGASGDDVTMILEKDEAFTFPFSMVARAKLMLTDELIDYSLQQQDAAVARVKALQTPDTTNPDSMES